LGTLIPNDVREVQFPSKKVLLKKLRNCPAVGKPGEFKPLILDSRNRLYLYRYWEYEKVLFKAIQERIGGETDTGDADVLRKNLNRIFQNDDNIQQQLACLVAVYKRFCVISGGPGTGKTFTISKLLALLLERQPLKIYLAAPTGKAAARLKEAIEASKSTLDCAEDVKKLIPSEAFTIHRLLRPIRHSPYLHHHQGNPLPADVVVIDEASMVDLALMSKLLQALPKASRLVLVGDKDQLASVEAGAVLGDICDQEQVHGFSREFYNHLSTAMGESITCPEEKLLTQPGLQDSIVLLEKNYRFPEKSGIACFSEAVRSGDPETAFSILEENDDDTLRWVPIPSPNALFRYLEKEIIEGYSPYLKAQDIELSLRKMSHFKILCVFNRGYYGIEEINNFSETILHRKGIISLDRSDWYPGKPIIVTRNNYELELFNGDMGTAQWIPGETGLNLRVCFLNTTGNMRNYLPQQLPEHETAYALTVHKSQGSEFDQVVVVLPEIDSPILTRELIYTAVTRARKQVTIYGYGKTLRSAISRKVTRTSGLRDALWQSSI
jgi:exodeoxyribonuclease V alpha subunit